VWRHTIGTNNSFSPVKPPDKPSAAPTYVVSYPDGDGYDKLSWAGLNVSTEVTYTGVATATGSSITSDGEWIIAHTGNGLASVKADVSALTTPGGGAGGTQDWSYNDRFAFTLEMESSAMVIDPSSVLLTLINADGSPVSFTGTIDWVALNGTTYAFLVKFDNKTRASWDNIKYWQLSYRVLASQGGGSRTMRLSQPVIGAVDLLAPNDDRDPDYVEIAYSYLNDSNGYESQLSPVLSLSRGQVEGQRPYLGLDGLGCHITLTMVTSADSAVTDFRIYSFWKKEQKWKLIVEQDDATTTYLYRVAWTELEAKTNRAAGAASPFTNCIGGFAFKGSMIWLFKGGDIKHARAGGGGSQEMFADALDRDDDEAAGANFALSDDYGDEAFVGAECGDSAVYGGTEGVYAQWIPGLATGATTIKRLPTSLGVANKFAATGWRDENGNPSFIAVSKNGEGVYGYNVYDGFDGDHGYRVVELTEGVRPSLRDYLLAQDSGGYTPTIAELRVFVDQAKDALYVLAGRRAMVLRRANIINNVRPWEFYEWSCGSAVTIKYVAASSRRRMRWMRSNGNADENEYNSASGAYITGSNRDGGSTMPSDIYWRSGWLSFPDNVRLLRVRVVRASGTHTVKAYSTRKPSGTSKQLSGASVEWVGFGVQQSGREHMFELRFAETDGAISKAMPVFTSPIGERVRK
jgi:hypothetical protein